MNAPVEVMWEDKLSASLFLFPSVNLTRNVYLREYLHLKKAKSRFVTFLHRNFFGMKDSFSLLWKPLLIINRYIELLSQLFCRQNFRLQHEPQSFFSVCATKSFNKIGKKFSSLRAGIMMLKSGCM